MDSFYGDALRVFGTLTVAPGMPITDTSISSALYIQQNSRTPIPLPSNPSFLGPVSDNLAWVFFKNTLFIDRIGNEASAIIWHAPLTSINMYAAFTLTSFDPSLEILFNIRDPSNFAYNEVFLAWSGPVGGTLLLGTIVPEPSSILMLSLIGTLIPLPRWRRC